MPIMERLTQDMKTAMKNKDKTRLSVIRMVRSSMKNEEIKLQRNLTEEDALGILSRELKQQKDSLQEFEQAGRDDLAAKAKAEIAILEDYLPEPLTEEEIHSIVREAIQKSGASSKADMGKVMKLVMPQVKGRADGKAVNRTVLEMLQ
ncbi:GatB/YqeY domain-containing protein [Kroppenstedtia pulmonis]|uniref:GatB/YqeY domain-containing protein n=1 Tax=Kroppenstedtia pulmonis TaxID=1380685 RepID=A0A7D4B324_9BACL|nr:GatB/YqeY domain-containing protein [Kroppenstedtia pulmonis]QKG84946.1 GatB/YqeY domain-containing protein [Kroppenstedtia pulmonis]